MTDFLAAIHFIKVHLGNRRAVANCKDIASRRKLNHRNHIFVRILEGRDTFLVFKFVRIVETHYSVFLPHRDQARPVDVNRVNSVVDLPLGDQSPRIGVPFDQ